MTEVYHPFFLQKKQLQKQKKLQIIWEQQRSRQ